LLFYKETHSLDYNPENEFFYFHETQLILSPIRAGGKGSPHFQISFITFPCHSMCWICRI